MGAQGRRLRGLWNWLHRGAWTPWGLHHACGALGAVSNGCVDLAGMGRMQGLRGQDAGEARVGISLLGEPRCCGLSCTDSSQALESLGQCVQRLVLSCTDGFGHTTVL